VTSCGHQPETQQKVVSGMTEATSFIFPQVFLDLLYLLFIYHLAQITLDIQVVLLYRKHSTLPP
jgi:hypothetical protein